MVGLGWEAASGGVIGRLRKVKKQGAAKDAENKVGSCGKVTRQSAVQTAFSSSRAAGQIPPRYEPAEEDAGSFNRVRNDSTIKVIFVAAMFRY